MFGSTSNQVNHNGFQQYSLFEGGTKYFNNILSVKEAPNYSTWVYFWQTQVAPHNALPQGTMVPQGTTFWEMESVLQISGTVTDSEIVIPFHSFIPERKPQ